MLSYFCAHKSVLSKYSGEVLSKHLKQVILHAVIWVWLRRQFENTPWLLKRLPQQIFKVMFQNCFLCQLNLLMLSYQSTTKALKQKCFHLLKRFSKQLFKSAGPQKVVFFKVLRFVPSSFPRNCREKFNISPTSIRQHQL